MGELWVIWGLNPTKRCARCLMIRFVLIKVEFVAKLTIFVDFFQENNYSETAVNGTIPNNGARRPLRMRHRLYQKVYLGF
jgi:hypothetical protein